MTRTPLAPLWMERSPIERMLKAAGGLGLPTWEQLEREHEVLVADVRAGRREWRYTADGGFDSPSKRLDITSHYVFAHLPSFERMLMSIREQIEAWGAEAGEKMMYGLMEEALDGTYATLMWRRFGRRVFVLDPDTYDLLARTTLPQLPSHALRFPLPAF